MTIQKLGVFGAKDEEAIVTELRDFFYSKGIKCEAVPSSDLYTSVKQFTLAAQKLIPSLSEKDAEHLMNAIFNLSITLPIDQSLDFITQLCLILKSPAFKGRGWNSHVSCFSLNGVWV
jgi:hypothetical protein